MYLGRVIGTVVATRRVSGLEGARFLVVQPVDHHQKPSGPIEVAVDRVSASPGRISTLSPRIRRAQVPFGISNSSSRESARIGENAAHAVAPVAQPTSKIPIQKRRKTLISLIGF